jgi:hypothetical protein
MGKLKNKRNRRKKQLIKLVSLYDAIPIEGQDLYNLFCPIKQFDKIN